MAIQFKISLAIVRQNSTNTRNHDKEQNLELFQASGKGSADKHDGDSSNVLEINQFEEGSTIQMQDARTPG